MKEIVIFGSYCNTKEKLQALENSIKGAKNTGLDVLVFARYPIPEYLQKQCDYYIFDKSNPVLTDRSLNHYLTIHDKYISNWFQDYGYAALEQIVKTLGFAKSLNYDYAYWLVYDVDTIGLGEFRNTCKEHLNTHDVVCHMFKRHSYAKEFEGVAGTSIGFKVGVSYDKLKGVMTETFYRDVISRRPNFIAEDFTEECFKISELNYYVLDKKPNLKPTLTSTGVRKHGDIPNEFTKTKQYFDHCNVGWDEDNNNINVFVWGLKQHIHSIIFDFGNEKRQLLDKGSRFEFNLDKKPLKCKIVEINGEPINETLDPEYTELYWKLFKIRNHK